MAMTMNRYKSAWIKKMGLCIVLAIVPTLPAWADTAYQTLEYSNVFAFYVAKTSAGVTEVPVFGRSYLYGTVTNTSRSSGGAVYRATTDGSVVETIYELSDSDGYIPAAGLLLAHDNNLYGSTVYGPRVGGNTSAGSGTLFRIALDGKGYTILHKFDETVALVDAQTGAIVYVNNDGALPSETLVDGNDGYLYGVAARGGVNGTGTVFKVRLDGNDFQVLHSFIYISSQTGLPNNYSADGASPSGALRLDPATGYLYGVTRGGGVAGNGTIYRIQTDGSQFQTIFSFEPLNGSISGLNDTTNCHGAVPTGQPVIANDVVYGMATQGGSDSSNCNGNSTGGFVGYGSVYAVAIKDIPASGLMDPSKFISVHDFQGTDGQSPVGDLVLASDGIFVYGETSSGTNSSTQPFSAYGSVFSIDTRAPVGSFNLGYGFSPFDSSSPTGHFVQGRDGYFYGTATSGGGCGGGAVFQLRSSGSQSQTGSVNCNTGGTVSNSNSLYGGGGGTMGGAFMCVLAALGFVPVVRRKLFSTDATI